ncbi:hypothetical protein H2198_008279 [Neophaeococcomyces mojaviensis]|uniref:Uncharacterized protein n=1 Tax=Neophaeococcomyces mojaviensis TaxID=3383035 RepID=A0ACC2ZXS0_9EURO|nr:hypothetical protein H2198_008279 [Knufia sp. JES_112]
MSRRTLTIDEALGRRHQFHYNQRADRAPSFSQQRNIVRFSPEQPPLSARLPQETADEASRRAAHEAERAVRQQEQERQRQTDLERRNRAIFGARDDPRPESRHGQTTVDVAAHRRLHCVHAQSPTTQRNRSLSPGRSHDHRQREERPQGRHRERDRNQDREQHSREDPYPHHLDPQWLGAQYRGR